MPIRLPTPEEMPGLPWYARDRAIQRCRMLLMEYGQVAEPAQRWTRTKISAAARQQFDRAEGEHIRSDAKQILARIGVDPDWQRHQDDLVEAVR